MNNLSHLTIQELQRLASIGVEAATMELGKRVIDYDFNIGVDRDATVVFLEAEMESLESQIEKLWRENSNLEYYNRRLRSELGLK